MITPSWEAFAPGEGEVVLTVDPGQAFGTGTNYLDTTWPHFVYQEDE